MAKAPASHKPNPPSVQPEDSFSPVIHNTITDESEDHRGPWVYDVTLTPSLNGIDPNYNKKDGV